MVRKLTSLLTPVRKRWNLPYRAALWTLALGIVAWSELYWLWLLVFVLVSITIYASQPRERAMLRSSYWIVTVISPLLVWFQVSSFIPLISSPGARAAVVIALGAVMWAILKIIHFSFTDTLFAYSLVNTSILVIFFLTAFHAVHPYQIGVVGLGMAAVLFFLFKEVYAFFNIPWKKSWILSALMGLIALELTWFVLLLPLGVLNATAFLVLFLVLVRDILLTHFRGELGTAFIFRQFTFLVLLTIIIFAASSWSL